MRDFYLFGGPNGAGKTTTAMRALPNLGCHCFLNADMIARGLSPLDEEAAAFRAGMLLMREVRRAAQSEPIFATESTLAARTYGPLVSRWREQGIRFNLIYVWLPSSEMAVQRVAARVRAGGHNIPEPVIHKRYAAGLKNFCDLYRELADRWTILDNSAPQPKVAASGGRRMETIVWEPRVWEAVNHGN